MLPGMIFIDENSKPLTLIAIDHATGLCVAVNHIGELIKKHKKSFYQNNSSAYPYSGANNYHHVPLGAKCFLHGIEGFIKGKVLDIEGKIDILFCPTDAKAQEAGIEPEWIKPNMESTFILDIGA